MTACAHQRALHWGGQRCRSVVSAGQRVVLLQRRSARRPVGRQTTTVSVTPSGPRACATASPSPRQRLSAANPPPSALFSRSRYQCSLCDPTRLGGPTSSHGRCARVRRIRWFVACWLRSEPAETRRPPSPHRKLRPTGTTPFASSQSPPGPKAQPRPAAGPNQRPQQPLSKPRK